MNHQHNIAIAQKLLEWISSDRSPTEIATLFDAEVVSEIQGDDGVLPWIGRKTGRRAVVNFARDIRTLTEPITFEVDGILASNSRAAIVGALQTRIKSTGKITGTQFAIILTITGDVVTRFQMLEDSFGVSKAARTRRDQSRRCKTLVANGGHSGHQDALKPEASVPIDPSRHFVGLSN